MHTKDFSMSSTTTQFNCMGSRSTFPPLCVISLWSFPTLCSQQFKLKWVFTNLEYIGKFMSPIKEESEENGFSCVVWNTGAQAMRLY